MTDSRFHRGQIDWYRSRDAVSAPRRAQFQTQLLSQLKLDHRHVRSGVYQHRCFQTHFRTGETDLNHRSESPLLAQPQLLEPERIVSQAASTPQRASLSLSGTLQTNGTTPGPSFAFLRASSSVGALARIALSCATIQSPLYSVRVWPESHSSVFVSALAPILFNPFRNILA